MTLDGSSSDAFEAKSGFIFWVKKNKLLTFKSITLSQPVSEKVSNGSAHAAPALLIRKSILSSLSLIWFAKFSTPSSELRSQPRAMHSPLYNSESSSAFAIRGPTFLAVI